MSYAFYIERERDREVGKRNRPILLEEWLAAIREFPELRLAEGDLEIANPQTGERISVGKNHGGDVEMEVYTGRVRRVWQRDWRRVFFWQAASGRVMFSPDALFDTALRTDLRLPLALARKLEAQVHGEEGEVYTSDFLD